MPDANSHATPVAGAALVVALALSAVLGPGCGPGEPPKPTQALAPKRAPAGPVLTGTVTGADVRGFVGKSRCLTCHQEQHAAWLPTAHSRALRPASKNSIHAPFTGAKATVGEGEAGFKVLEVDGELFVDCLGPDRTMGRFRIAR